MRSISLVAVAEELPQGYASISAASGKAADVVKADAKHLWKAFQKQSEALAASSWHTKRFKDVAVLGP